MNSRSALSFRQWPDGRAFKSTRNDAQRTCCGWSSDVPGQRLSAEARGIPQRSGKRHTAYLETAARGHAQPCRTRSPHREQLTLDRTSDEVTLDENRTQSSSTQMCTVTDFSTRSLTADVFARPTPRPSLVSHENSLPESQVLRHSLAAGGFSTPICSTIPPRSAAYSAGAATAVPTTSTSFLNVRCFRRLGRITTGLSIHRVNLWFSSWTLFLLGVCGPWPE